MSDTPYLQKENDSIHDNFDSIFREILLNNSLQEIYDYYSELKDPKGKGKIAFLIFSVAIEQSYSSEPNNSPLKHISKLSNEERKRYDNAKTILNKISEDENLRKFIIVEYEININLADITEFQFYRMGTTSYIIKISIGTQNTEKKFALKILKYRYINDRTINIRTNNYKVLYSDLDFTPNIYQCAEKYILMDFIEGPTLHEFIYHTLKNETINRDKLNAKVISELCRILHYYTVTYGIIHSDINPDNIIIDIEYTKDTDNINDLKLFFIDFGVNYLLNEKIGTSKALTRARIYIADEVLDNYQNASIISDIYSLGVIILEMYNIYNDFEYRKFDEYLDNIRLKEPGLASILDDILDKKPNLRLFDLQAKYLEIFKDSEINNPKNLFVNYRDFNDDLKNEITQCFSHIYLDLNHSLNLLILLSEVKKGKKSRDIFSYYNDIMDISTGQISSVGIKIFPEIEVLKSVTEEDPNSESNFRIITKKLTRWAFVAKLSNGLVIFGSFFYLLLYINKVNEWFKFYSPVDVSFAKAMSVIVLLTYSFIAFKYYTNIFSNLYPKKLGKLGYLTNICIKFCTFYWPGPILYSIYTGKLLYSDAAWIGLFVVSINNLLNYKLGCKSKREIEETFHVTLPKNLENRLKEFNGWWPLILIVAAFLFLVGRFLSSGILKDNIAYMVIILFVNIKMWLFNCTKLAPNVNKTLQFLYTRYYRALKYKEIHSK